MALNIALPLSGVPELFERCGLLSPLTPDFQENLQLLVKPFVTESSESSDSDDAKNDKPSSDEENTQHIEASQSTESAPLSKSPSSSSLDEVPPRTQQRESKIFYQGRDILDLAGNMTYNSDTWKFRHAHLPDNNLTMFMQNRSQYHRLSSTGHIQEFDISDCHQCTFEYPVDSVVANGQLIAKCKRNESNVKAHAPHAMTPSIRMYKHF